MTRNLSLCASTNVRASCFRHSARGGSACSPAHQPTSHWHCDCSSAAAGGLETLIYSGPIDEYFGRCYGSLPYRSLRFEWQTVDVPQVQPVAVINHPNQHDYTRVTEFKHLTGQEHRKSALLYEYPSAEGEPYYPIPRPENAELYRKYKALADATPNVHFLGRLGSYRYYNMDQCVAQALALFDRLRGARRADVNSVVAAE